MRTLDIKKISDKTGVLKEEVNISESFLHYSIPAMVPLMVVLWSIQR
jgi:hypothetical protein